MKRTALAGLALALWCGVQAEGRLTGVETHKVGQGVEIQVQGQDLAKPKVLRVNNNRSYILEFDAVLVGGRKQLRVNSGGVQYVTAGWFKSRPPVVRVHVWLKGNQNPQLTQNESGWLIGVNVPKKTDRAAQGFPDKVPQIAYSQRTKPVRRASYQPDVSQKIVSVNGHGTEVVLILRALAMQSGANIITGPEVAGKITVELKGVTLIEALDYVTTLARVRYAKVGKTYVVTSNARFAEAMRQIANKLEENGETRVVQLVSGEGVQLKAATMKALPQFTAQGSYDIILPTEQIEATSFMGSGVGGQEQGTTGSKSEAKTEDTTGAGATGGSGSSSDKGGEAGSKDKTTDTGTSGAESKTLQLDAKVGGVTLTANSADRTKTGAKDAYLLVVGTPERVEQVVDFISKLDDKVARAANVGPNRDIDTRVVPVYCGQVPKIRTALQALVDRDARKAAFSIADSRLPKNLDQTGIGEGSNNGDIDLLFITGPKDSLDNMVQFAKSLDEGICEASSIPYATTPEESKRSYVVVDLKHVEPFEAADELNRKIRGVQASIMPSPVDPLVHGDGDTKIDGVKQPAKGTKTIATSETTAREEAAARGGGEGTDQTSGGTGGGTTTTSGAGAASTSGTEATKGMGSGVKLSKAMGTEPMRLLLYGTKAQVEAARDLLNVIDVAPKQVALELRVMELSHEDVQKIGLDWNILTGGTLKTFRANQSLGGLATTAGNVSSAFNLKGGDTADLLATLDEGVDKNKMIARPNALANDGRPVEMFVGDTVRYVESIQPSQNGTTIQTAEIDIGVTLVVTARVGGDMITLDLRPKLTLLKGFTPVGEGAQIPQTSERRVTTIASLRSGETLAIGGLIQDQDKRSFYGIPILKDIPIIGRLFSRTDNLKVRREVVFFLTAKVVNDTERADAAHPAIHNGDVMPGPKTTR